MIKQEKRSKPAITPFHTDKRAVSLRISVAVECQLRCFFCMPNTITPLSCGTSLLSFEQILTFTRYLKKHFGLTKIHITGGEPLTRRGITDLLVMLSDENPVDLALTTNGQRPDMIESLKRAGLKRINISLVSLRRDTFQRITGGGDLALTLKTVQEAHRHRLHPVKLNMLVLRNINDDEVCEMVDFGLQAGCEIRFLELMPIGPGADLFESLFISSAQVIERIERSFDLRSFTDKSDDSGLRFEVIDSRGRSGRVGFITSCSAPFCRNCNRLRLTAEGRLLGCLALDGGEKIGRLLTDGDVCDEQELRAVIELARNHKRRNSHFTTKSTMIAIGG